MSPMTGSLVLAKDEAGISVQAVILALLRLEAEDEAEILHIPVSGEGVVEGKALVVVLE